MSVYQRVWEKKEGIVTYNDKYQSAIVSGSGKTQMFSWLI
jgi:hypothetical protein